MTKRVLTGQIKHETNTFSVLPTTLASYRARLLLEGFGLPLQTTELTEN